MPVYGDFDQRCLVEAELLATERLMTPYRFWFETPDHLGTEAIYRIHEVFTGLEGQTRIKLVDATGRVSFFDRDQVSCSGLVRDG